MPTTVEEIQEIVRVANEHKVPLWTHGQGRNNGYGGPAPRVRGSVIVSLRRMNRVLEIDEELGYALVEPGVRWFDLYEAIQAGGHKLMLSVPDLGWGSVVGNTLDHGVTYLPYGRTWRRSAAWRSCSPNGDAAAHRHGRDAGQQSWHLYKRGLGPTPDQLFMQSNFGIVTKMGIWLMPTAGVLHAALAAGLAGRRSRAGGRHAAPADARPDDRPRAAVPEHDLLASVMTKREQWHDGEGPIPDAVDRRDGRELEIGRWMMRFGLYGDEAVVDHRFEKIKEAFEQIPGPRCGGRSTTGAVRDTRERDRARAGRRAEPRPGTTMTGWYGGEEGGHIGFSPVARSTGGDALALRDLLRG